MRSEISRLMQRLNDAEAQHDELSQVYRIHRKL